ncbi:hypothetical protein RB595_003708 [Gaeumannomyces hyphopodioides]
MAEDSEERWPPYMENIQRWRLSEPPAVLERLSRYVGDRCLREEEKASFQENFAAVCGPDQIFTEASLVSWITANLPADRSDSFQSIPALSAAIPLLFQAMCNLSTYPFIDNQPAAPAGLTYGDLLRVFCWGAPVGLRLSPRQRSPADCRRALFQAFATRVPANGLPFDEARWRDEARRRALAFPAPHIEFWGAGWLAEETPINRNDDGDEIFHDLVDMLHQSQDEVDLGVAMIARGVFKKPAKKLKANIAPLQDYVMGEEELRVLVTGLVTLQGCFTDQGDNLPISGIDRKGIDMLVFAFGLGAGESNAQKINYEVFDRVVAKAASGLFRPFHLLIDAFAKPLVPQEKPWGGLGALGNRPDGSNLSYQRLAQLRTLTQDSACVPTEELTLGFEWDRAVAPTVTSQTTAALLAAMRAEAENDHEAILLVRGQPVNGDRMRTFGFYSGRLPADEHKIQHPSHSNENHVPALLFQLGPVQDGFPGALYRPAWAVEKRGGEEPTGLRFGHVDAGAALCLDLAAGRATFHHKVSPTVKGENEGPQEAVVYEASFWRGSWEVEMEVDKVELWQLLW